MPHVTVPPPREKPSEGRQPDLSPVCSPRVGLSGNWHSLLCSVSPPKAFIFLQNLPKILTPSSLNSNSLTHILWILVEVKHFRWISNIFSLNKIPYLMAKKKKKIPISILVFLLLSFHLQEKPWMPEELLSGSSRNTAVYGFMKRHDLCRSYVHLTTQFMLLPQLPSIPKGKF